MIICGRIIIQSVVVLKLFTKQNKILQYQTKEKPKHHIKNFNKKKDQLHVGEQILTLTLLVTKTNSTMNNSQQKSDFKQYLKTETPVAPNTQPQQIVQHCKTGLRAYLQSAESKQSQECHQ